MTRRLLAALAGSLVLGAAAAAQAPAPAPRLEPVWTLAGEFSLPESAYYDDASNTIFVSSINGQILEKDGNGYISRLSPDGRLLSAKWAAGLNAPKGMRTARGLLWVSDIDEIVGLEIATARVASRVRIEGAQFLNDLAAAPDGAVYVSDSNLSRVYEVRDGKASIFVEGAELGGQPNGLLVDGGRLILGTIGPAVAAGRGPQPGAGGGRGRGPGDPGGHLFAFDLKTRQRTQLTTQPVGGIDGIEPDGRGGVIVTDVFGLRILHVAASGDVRTLTALPAAGADLGYIPATRTAIVPFLFGNSVAAYDLAAALR